MGSFCDKVGTEGSLRATGCRQKTGSQSEEAPDKENIYVLAHRILNPNIRVSGLQQLTGTLDWEIDSGQGVQQQVCFFQHFFFKYPRIHQTADRLHFII